jgi:hypothetical protein
MSPRSWNPSMSQTISTTKDQSKIAPKTPVNQSLDAKNNEKTKIASRTPVNQPLEAKNNEQTKIASKTAVNQSLEAKNNEIKSPKASSKPLPDTKTSIDSMKSQ